MNTRVEAAQAAGAAPARQSLGGRLGFIDWARGCAALTMLNGHVFHSFTAASLREDSTYILTQFLGGMPPAVFLFLTGCTFAFLLDSNDRKELSWRESTVVALRRAGYLWGLAFLFRFQLWLFGQPSSPWTDLLKVDILNCMGLALAVLTPTALWTTRERARRCVLVGAAVAAFSPVVTAMDWNWVPDPVKDYFVPSYAYFAFFPWAAFVPFGMSFGSILRLIRPEHLNRFLEWSAIIGFGLIIGGQYFGNIPYSLYVNSEFWLDSPALVFVKLGVVLLLMAVAYLYHEYGLHGRFSWVKLVGTHSLLVYWVHTEIVYGRWFWMWKNNLDLRGVIAMSAVVIAMMLWLCYAWEKRRGGKRIPPLRPAPMPGV